MRFALAAFAAVLLAGCATLTDGTDQTIILSITPREARCAAERNGVEVSNFCGTNPQFTVCKGAKDIIVTCKAPGYETKVSRLVSSTTGSGMMSFLFLDLGITDMVTGAMWKYPNSTGIALEPIAGALIVVPAVAVAQRAPVAQPVAVATPTLSSGVVQIPTLAASPPPQVPIGQDAFSAEKLARESKCDVNPNAKLVAKGPGYESFTVQCTNADALLIRCEMGNCRALK